MNCFTDTAGRPWALRIVIADLPRLRAAGLDVGAVVAASGDFLPLLTDAEVLGPVLWVLCEPQAIVRAINPEQFAAAVDGPAVAAAAEAIAAALADFFPPPAEDAGGDAAPVDTADPLWLDDLCWGMAGIAGVNPQGLTLRELVALADARERAEWGKLASLAVMVYQAIMSGTNPVEFIPDRYRPHRAKPAEQELTPEQQAVETKVMLSGLAWALGQMNRQTGK